jgi:hypothetical protein
MKINGKAGEAHLGVWSAAVLRRFGMQLYHSTTGTKSTLTLKASVLNR